MNSVASRFPWGQGCQGGDLFGRDFSGRIISMMSSLASRRQLFMKVVNTMNWFILSNAADTTVPGV